MLASLAALANSNRSSTRRHRSQQQRTIAAARANRRIRNPSQRGRQRELVGSEEGGEEDFWDIELDIAPSRSRRSRTTASDEQHHVYGDDVGFGDLQEYFDLQHNLNITIEQDTQPQSPMTDVVSSEHQDHVDENVADGVPYDEPYDYYQEDQQENTIDYSTDYDHFLTGYALGEAALGDTSVNGTGAAINASYDASAQQYLEVPPSDDILNSSPSHQDRRRRTRSIGNRPQVSVRRREEEEIQQYVLHNDNNEDDDSVDEAALASLSPAVQQQNRRIKKMRCFLRLGREVKSLIVVLIILYTVYLQVFSVLTNNWDATRLMGFSESGQCTSSTELYGITSFNVYTLENEVIDNDDYFTSTAYKPFAYTIHGSSNSNIEQRFLCLSAKRLSQCSSVLQSLEVGENLLEFKSFFRRDEDRSYFPFTTLLDVLCVGSLLIAGLYEFDHKNRNFVGLGEGQFSTRATSRLMQGLNGLIVLAIGVLCILAAGSYRNIYDENCKSVYKGKSSRESYCNLMESCGLGLSSTIEPNDVLVESYFFIMLLLGILSIFALLLRFILPKRIAFVGVLPVANSVPMEESGNEGSHIGIDITEDVRDSDSDDDSDSDETSSVDQGPNVVSGPTNAAIEGSVPPTPSEIAARISLMLARADDTLWTVLPCYVSDKIDDECTICLGDFKSNLCHHGTFAVPLKENGDVQPKVAEGIEISSSNPRSDEAHSVEDPVVQLCRCDHHFHRKCIVQWLEQNNRTCPICRSELE